jgi:ribonuclease P protein subunit RPR2
MAKGKPDGIKKVPHPHLYARLSFLQQAAQLLEEQQHSTPVKAGKQQNDGRQKQNLQPVHDDTAKVLNFNSCSNTIARELSSHTTAITRKSKLRIAPDVKRTICKRCSSKLIEGATSFSRIENKSRIRQKAWADVLVITCRSCNLEKRFPIGQTRGTKKVERNTETNSKPSADIVADG